MGHTRVVSVSNTDFPDSGPNGIPTLDPAELLGSVDPALLVLSDKLVVKLWDDNTSVMYPYNSFMSRKYRISDGRCHFGAKRIKLAGMTILLGVRIECEDLDSMTETLD
jgi:hypothetical protein